MTSSNGTARAEVERLTGLALAEGRKPDIGEISRQVDSVSTRTVRRWVDQAVAGDRPAVTDGKPAVTSEAQEDKPVLSPPGQKSTQNVTARRRRDKPAVSHRPVIDRWIAWLVAVTVALLSASHIIDLAVTAGLGWRAWLSPVSLDGLAIAALLAWSAGRHRTVAALGIAAGVVGSVAANVLAVRPELADMDDVAAVLAAFPPVALAVVIHLVRQ